MQALEVLDKPESTQYVPLLMGSWEDDDGDLDWEDDEESFDEFDDEDDWSDHSQYDSDDYENPDSEYQE